MFVYLQDCSQRLFDKGEMNVYRDPVAFIRSIVSTLTALFGLDLQRQVCSFGIMVDIPFEAVAHTGVAQPELTPDGDQPRPRLTSDGNLVACMKNEHFLKFVLEALSSLTNDLGLLLSSCQRTDVYMNSGRYMTLCQTLYKAKVVLFLFRKQILNTHSSM